MDCQKNQTRGGFVRIDVITIKKNYNKKSQNEKLNYKSITLFFDVSDSMNNLHEHINYIFTKSRLSKIKKVTHTNIFSFIVLSVNLNCINAIIQCSFSG